jgi:hypothetical protein
MHPRRFTKQNIWSDDDRESDIKRNKRNERKMEEKDV